MYRGVRNCQSLTALLIGSRDIEGAGGSFQSGWGPAVAAAVSTATAEALGWE